MHHVGNPPAPAKLHGPDVHLVHLRGNDGAVALFDQCAGDPTPTEFARKAEDPPALHQRSERESFACGAPMIVVSKY